MFDRASSVPSVSNVIMLNATGAMTFDDWIIEGINLRVGNERAFDLMRNHRGNGILLLEGGGDINPKLYGEENKYSHFYGDSRDNWEVECFNNARELDIPILGICRGHQMIAALSGGTLHQDIQRCLGVSHSGSHFVDTFGIMKEWYPEGRYVNSLHHQAVNRVPDSAVVVATSRDGVIEALAYPDDKMFSVQWHPELSSDVELLTFIVRSFFRM